MARRRLRWVPAWVVVWGATVALAASALGQELGKYVGQPVVPTAECRIMNGETEIPLNSLNVPYLVRAVVDGWLDVGPGYVLPEHVLTLEAAIPYCAARIAVDPTDRAAYNLRGVVRKERGDLDLAILDFNEAIRLDPTEAETYNNRGSVCRARGEFERAVKDFDEAIRLDPQYATAFDNRGSTKLEHGDFDAAIADYTEAVRLDPVFAAAFHNRGFAYTAKKDFEKALKDFNEAMRLDPQQAAPFDAAAWLLATCPVEKHRNGVRAVELALKARSLADPNDPGLNDTLAAAYAEQGDFAKAVSTEEEVLASIDKDHPERAAYEARRDLYRAQKPFRAE